MDHIDVQTIRNDNTSQLLDAAAAAVRFRRATALREHASLADLLEQARIGAKLLKSLGASRVRVFGSVARATEPDWHTDVDFAVEGLPPSRYFEALGELLIKLTCRVDLVEYECASESLRNEIDRDGLEL
jgi:predicted nucleotidyltransferase